MMAVLKQELELIEETIEHMEQSDLSYLPSYTTLKRRRRIIKRTIRQLEKLERKEVR